MLLANFFTFASQQILGLAELSNCIVLFFFIICLYFLSNGRTIKLVFSIWLSKIGKIQILNVFHDRFVHWVLYVKLKRWFCHWVVYL